MNRIKQLLQALVATTFALVPLVVRLTGIEVLRNFLQLPARSFESARPLMALPLVVGLLAVTPDGVSAQCWACGLCDWGDNFTICCSGGMSGYDNCAQGFTPPGFIYCDSDGPGCEDDLWAMDASTDRKAITTVMEGGMLAAASGYFFVVDGSDKVLRRKCSGALVARVVESPQRLAFETRTWDPSLEWPLPWSFGSDQPVRAGQG